MKKNLFLAALAFVALASCTSDEFVGDQSPQTTNGNGAISFDMNTPRITRSTSDDVTKLNSNFVVYGYKTVSSTSQVVFDNYQVNWVTNTAGTTESNSANWEYVSYINLPGGVGTNAGVTAFAATTTGSPNNSTAVEQSIKYWDFSASSYDFFAYSLGTGSSSTWAKASAMSNSTYTLEGTAAQLGTCYISNKKNVVPSTSATQVTLEFRSFLSKIELKFYETIPGYSVKEVKFYPSATGGASTTPYLYASSEALPTGGKYTVTFDDGGNAQLTFDDGGASSKTYASNIAFSSTLTGYAARDYKETEETIYLGRASDAATSTDMISVLPNPGNNQALHLMMDFTLVSRDGSGETINMKGATAVIPAAYAMWKPNYKYTYIFKISDNTNAKTGAITGLYPITLDAVVSDAVDGTQETITTVDDPSITTYAKGTMVTANNEYLTGANIYIVVNDGTNIIASSDAKLYTATIQDGAAQGITEATVANALEHGTQDPTGTWTVTDANSKNLVVTTADGLSNITEIAAADAPNGHAITINGFKFTPASAGYYVFEYSAPAVNYTQDEVNSYNAGLPGAVSTANTYSFTSYADNSGTIQHGTGMVKVISKDNTWTTVEVISNVPIDANANNANFVGHQFMVKATTLTENQYYQLYSDKNEDSKLPIYVTVAASTPAEVNAYNATLPGHKSSGDTKPAAKHYKVIKVVASGS